MCTGDAGKSALETKGSSDDSGGDIARKSTRQWAEDIAYDTCKLFNKVRSLSFFSQNIYVLHILSL